jgi:hypothetical protein
LSGHSVLLNSDALDLKWSPVQGEGTVEATIASFFQPDAGLTASLTRCSAPVSQGELLVPVPGGGSPRVPTAQSWRALAVRVLNRASIQTKGLDAEAIVASFDSGVLIEALPTVDAGPEASLDSRAATD